MKRLLVITDSVGLPKPDIALKYDDTYIGLMEQQLGDVSVWVLSGGGFTIQEFNMRVNNLVGYMGDNKMFSYCVLAIGLVDCANRLLPRVTRDRIAHLPYLLRSTAVSILRVIKPSILRFHPIQYTPLDEYCSEYTKLITALNRVCEKIITVQIAPVSAEFLERATNTDSQIIQYNKKIKEIANTFANCRVIDISNDSYVKNESVYLTNEGHITKEMHQEIWLKIKDVLKS